jgi:hypothetical protein
MSAQRMTWRQWLRCAGALIRAHGVAAVRRYDPAVLERQTARLDAACGSCDGSQPGKGRP